LLISISCQKIALEGKEFMLMKNLLKKVWQLKRW